MSIPKGPFFEYSVVYSDRVFNLMSPPFQASMRSLSHILKSTYNAEKVALIPGSGSYAMEAVARQFATNKKALVIRNGFFSFRWSDIFEVCSIPSSEVVLKATPVDASTSKTAFEPPSLETVLATIRSEKPRAVFAPHCETATGILLSDEYIKAVAAATDEVGGIFVLDGIAAGSAWIDMEALGVDCMITAPQKAWSGPACVGVVLLSKSGVAKFSAGVAAGDKPTSFCVNLPKWLSVMEAYEKEGFSYYTTLPTDAIMQFEETARDVLAMSLPATRANHFELGKLVAEGFKARGFLPLAKPCQQAPGVVVVHTRVDGPTGPVLVGLLKKEGVQIAGGVPLQIDEKAACGLDSGTDTFRIGLFGLEKIKDPRVACERLLKAFDAAIEKWAASHQQ